MKRGERILLGVVAAVVLLGIGGGGLLLLESGGSHGPATREEGDGGSPTTSGEPRAEVDDGTVPAPPPRTEPPAPPVPSDLPLVEILVHRRFDPYAAGNNRGAPERGAGRSSALDGLVTDAAGTAVAAARLRFLHGLNAGEETAADGEGRYAFARLYPGASLLEIEVPGMEPVVREVRLLPDRPERANFHLAPPVDVAGRVLDRRGKPVAGAELRIDRRTTTSDEEGRFTFLAITPGPGIAYVRAKGFAPLRAPLEVAAGIDPDRIRLVLEPAGTLLGETRGSPFEGGAPYLALVPDTPPIDRSFPFEEFGRIEVQGNAPFEIPGVPLRKLLRVRAFHPYSRAKPPMRTVFLREDGERNIVPASFQFEPVRPVRGRVLDGETGRALAGASVSLEVADLFRESVAALPGAGGTLNAYVATPPADLKSTAKTDAEGRFLLGTGEGEGWRWLVVTAPGYRPLERAIPGAKAEIGGLVLFKEGAFPEGGKLVVFFSASHARRIALTLNASAKPEAALAAEDPFVLGGLEPGLYEVKVRLGGKTVFSQPDVPIGSTREIRVPE
ncbi:MAG: carboxypeptidase-like regulatory domain-containing protein [Planctomycetes bacterium]|nr:carboxypeptidase-like regulatory domain-containing protein [Planctomycetota bacterium]